MADLDRDFFLGELLTAYRRNKKALCFHLGVRQKHILREWLDENTEVVLVLHTGRQAKDEYLAQILARDRKEKNWKRFLNVFKKPEKLTKTINNYISEAEQDWRWGLSALEYDPHNAVQSMLNAIGLLDQCLGICESGAGKNLRQLHKLNSAYGGVVKATRFNGIKAEVINLLEARPESWKTKDAAIEYIVKNLRPYIEKHGWPSAQDKNDSRDATEIETGSLYNSLKRWSGPDGDEKVREAFVKAIRK